MATIKRMSAKNAKNGFGRLIDTAISEPVMIEKHGRPVVVVLSIQEFERLKSNPAGRSEPEKPSIVSPPSLLE